MIYENLRTQGIITEASQPSLVERVSTPELVSPEQVYLTRVTIKQTNGSRSAEIFGVIPQNYVGRDVELVESYHELPHQKLFMQELCVDGQRVINQAVVKTK